LHYKIILTTEKPSGSGCAYFACFCGSTDRVNISERVSGVSGGGKPLPTNALSSGIVYLIFYMVFMP